MIHRWDWIVLQTAAGCQHPRCSSNSDAYATIWAKGCRWWHYEDGFCWQRSHSGEVNLIQVDLIRLNYLRKKLCLSKYGTTHGTNATSEWFGFICLTAILCENLSKHGDDIQHTRPSKLQQLQESHHIPSNSFLHPFPGKQLCSCLFSLTSQDWPPLPPPSNILHTYRALVVANWHYQP